MNVADGQTIKPRLYARALKVKPDFDIALANMANAVKDAVSVWRGRFRRALNASFFLAGSTFRVYTLLSTSSASERRSARSALWDGSCYFLGL